MNIYRVVRSLLATTFLTSPWLAGCFKASTLVTVNPDGHGRIVESIALRKDVIAMLSSFTNPKGEKGGPKEEDILSLQQFQKKAPEYGEGVRYLGARKSQEGDYVRATAEYAFHDITKVRLKTNNAPEVSQSGSQTPKLITFSILQDVNSGVSDLTIKLPPPLEAAPKMPEENKSQTSRQPTPEQEQIMMQMFKDAEMSIRVACGNEIISSNATHHDGNTVTLLHLSFAKLMENPEGLKKLEQLGPPGHSLDDIRTVLQGVKGIEIELQPQVTVKYR